MEKLGIAIAALCPCLVFLVIFIFATRKCIPTIAYRETILCFSLGVLSCIPLLLWQLLVGHWERSWHQYPVAFALYGAFIMAALPEEFCRYLILRWRLSRLSTSVDLKNCLLLGCIVGLGLGTIEHLVYCYSEGWQACWERLLTAVLIHTMAGAIVGYFVGLSIIKRNVYWGLFGIVITITLHSIHNFLMTYLYEHSQSSFADGLYWPIRILIELIYVVLVVLLFRKARKAAQLVAPANSSP